MPAYPKRTGSRRPVHLPCLDVVRVSGHRSFAQPTRAFTLRPRDAKRRAKRGAEATGQRTARGRLLRGVRRRPLRQIYLTVTLTDKSVQHS
jgi:hypothetical protein